MDIRVVKPGELTEDELSAWRCCLGEEVYGSPFFEPDFTRLLGAVRDDVEVAVLSSGDAPVGFLPFHRDRHDVGRPVGLRLSDYHGPILAPGTSIDPSALLEQVGLRAWYFDHLPVGVAGFESWSLVESPSPYLDLSQGYDAYRAANRKAGHASITQIERKRRKLAREVGPLRFEANSLDPAAFADLVRWKSRQRELTASFDVLRVPWVCGYLEQLWQRRDDRLSAPLATLHAGDELVAVHLGLRGERVLHYWFPTYNPAFGAYSPGLILILELARQAAEERLLRLDLGKGPERYKRNLSSGVSRLALGVVDRRPIHHAAFRFGHWTKRCLSRTPLVGPLSASKRMLRRSRLASIMRES